MKIHLLEATFSHADGERTDMMNLVVSFYSFANTPKTMYVNADDEIRIHKLKLMIIIRRRRRRTTTTTTNHLRAYSTS